MRYCHFWNLSLAYTSVSTPKGFYKQNEKGQPIHNTSKGRSSERLRVSTLWMSVFQVGIWMFQFYHTRLRGILPWASSSSFFCTSSGISGPLHHCFCHPRHASLEPSLGCFLPWLLSPTAVWAPQLGPPSPCGFCELYSAVCQIRGN